MRVTLLCGAGDVRVENVPDSAVKHPTDALVRITSSCVCGSDLWPYASMTADSGPARMGHEFIGVVEDTGFFRLGQIVAAADSADPCPAPGCAGDADAVRW